MYGTGRYQLSEIRQPQKDKYHMVSLTNVISKTKKQTKNQKFQSEHRMMITSLREAGGA